MAVCFVYSGNDVIDLDVILTAYAQDLFKKTATCKQNRTPMRKLKFNFDWKKVKCGYGKPAYAEEGNPTKNAGKTHTLKIYTSTHENNTELVQEYLIKVSLNYMNYGDENRSSYNQVHDLIKHYDM